MALRQHRAIRIWPQTPLILMPLLLAMAACSRQPVVPASGALLASSPAPSLAGNSNQSGPFPTHSFAEATIPRGTVIAVRLQSALSSSRCRAGDVFTAVLDQPVVVQGETLLSEGTRVTGRVVSARSSKHSLQADYLRLTLSSIAVGDKTVELHTSAIFAKGGAKNGRRDLADSVPQVEPVSRASGRPQQLSAEAHQVEFSTERQLTFWLIQPATMRN